MKRWGMQWIGEVNSCNRVLWNINDGVFYFNYLFIFPPFPLILLSFLPYFWFS
jgi:hypothetical protein